MEGVASVQDQFSVRFLAVDKGLKPGEADIRQFAGFGVHHFLGAGVAVVGVEHFDGRGFAGLCKGRRG